MSTSQVVAKTLSKISLNVLKCRNFENIAHLGIIYFIILRKHLLAVSMKYILKWIWRVTAHLITRYMFIFLLHLPIYIFTFKDLSLQHQCHVFHWILSCIGSLLRELRCVRNAMGNALRDRSWSTCEINPRCNWDVRAGDEPGSYKACQCLNAGGCT